MRAFAFLIFLLLLAPVAHAQYPTVSQKVSDLANILSSDEEGALTLMLDQLEQNTSVQIAVVTVPTTGGDERVNFAARVGEQSGVGNKDRDDGIVILYSLDSEKGGAIATGRGIGSVLTDVKVSRIGREVKPLFDEGKYAQGFGLIIERIGEELLAADYRGQAVPQCSFNGRPVDCKQFYKVILIIVIFGIGLLVSLGRHKFGSFGPGMGGFYGGGLGGGMGGGGFSGGGGFGGGSFGGGGGKF